MILDSTRRAETPNVQKCGTAEIGRPERSELAALTAVATTDLLNEFAALKRLELFDAQINFVDAVMLRKWVISGLAFVGGTRR